MYRKFVLVVLLILPLLIFSGCGKKVEFTFSDMDFDHEVDSYESYTGTGTVETESDGSYYALLGYEKDGGDSDDTEGEYQVVVAEGEGEIYTYDSSYNLDVGEVLDEPEYTFENLGYVEFKPVKEGDFIIEDFEIDVSTDEYSKDFSGSGTITTDKKGVYLVLVYYEMDGGDPNDDDEGYNVYNVIDGEGELITYDFFDVTASYDDVEYDFEVMGYIQFNAAEEKDFEISDFEVDQVEDGYWTDYIGEGTIETAKKGNYLLLVEIDKNGGNEYGGDGYYIQSVIDGEGLIETSDTDYGIDANFEEPEYEFDILGYIQLN